MAVGARSWRGVAARAARAGARRSAVAARAAAPATQARGRARRRRPTPRRPPPPRRPPRRARPARCWRRTARPRSTLDAADRPADRRAVSASSRRSPRTASSRTGSTTSILFPLITRHLAVRAGAAGLGGASATARAANPIPSKTSHNTLIEVVWTLVPVLILVAIAVPSIGLLAGAVQARARGCRDAEGDRQPMVLDLPISRSRRLRDHRQHAQGEERGRAGRALPHRCRRPAPARHRQPHRAAGRRADPPDHHRRTT